MTLSSLWRYLADLNLQLWLSAPISMVVLQCLVAIWAATSKGHWFWRALAVWGAIMLMVPIRAWEPAWLFGLASPLIIAGLLIGKRIGRPRRLNSILASEAAAIGSAGGRWRFSLRDLLALVLIISLWLPGILEVLRTYNYQPRNWLGWLASSSSLAALSLTSYALVVSPLRWLDVGLLSFALLEIALIVWINEMLELPLAVGLFLIACGIIAAFAALAAYGIGFPWRHWLALLVLVMLIPICSTAVCLAGPWMRHLDPVNLLMGPTTSKVVHLALIFAEFSAMLVLIMALAHGIRSADLARRWRFACGGALALFGGAIVVWLSVIYADLLVATAPRWPVETDGRSLQLDRVQRIAIEIRYVNDQIGNWQPLSFANLPADPTLAPARLKLEALYQQLLPMLDSVSAVDPESSAKAKAGFRRGLIAPSYFDIPSRQLQAEFESALAKKNWNAATDYALALIKLGDILARGGIETEARMGSEIRATGHQCLVQIRDHVPPDQLRNVIGSLQRSQQERGDPALIHARQLDFDEDAYGWGLRLQRVIERRLGKRRDRNEEYLERHYATRDLQCLLVGPLLQTELAVRLFKNDHGRLPRDLSELVPEYLASAPLDVYSQPLVLKSVGETFVIYSIGWDQFDDGGTFSNWWDYETGHRRWQREKGTWITHERREGEPRQYMGQPGIDFDLDTPTRSFVDDSVP